MPRPGASPSRPHADAVDRPSSAAFGDRAPERAVRVAAALAPLLAVLSPVVLEGPLSWRSAIVLAVVAGGGLALLLETGRPVRSHRESVRRYLVVGPVGGMAGVVAASPWLDDYWPVYTVVVGLGALLLAPLAAALAVTVPRRIADVLAAAAAALGVALLLPATVAWGRAVLLGW